MSEYIFRNTKPAASALRVTLLLLIALTVLTGCKEERITINTDNYIKFLEADSEQEPALRKLLGTARDIIQKYYTKYDAAVMQSGISDEEELDLKMDFLREIHPVINDINAALSPDQQFTFRRSELYYYYSDIQRNVLTNHMLGKRLSYEKEVFPAIETDETDSTVYIEDWTVFFGQNVFPSYYADSERSMTRAARRGFPIGIQATLFNNYSRENPAGLNVKPTGNEVQPATEICIVLYSRLHKDFTDIDRWVIYLKLPDGSLVEPEEIIPRTEEWFRKKNLLLSSRLPDFLMPSRLQTGRRREDAGIARGREELFKLNSAYYQLTFPFEVDGKPLISPANENIKIIVQEEVGSRELAHGTWKLSWHVIY